MEKNVPEAGAATAAGWQPLGGRGTLRSDSELSERDTATAWWYIETEIKKRGSLFNIINTSVTDRT